MFYGQRNQQSQKGSQEAQKGEAQGSAPDVAQEFLTISRVVLVSSLRSNYE